MNPLRRQLARETKKRIGKGVPHFSPKLREVGIEQQTTIVIPTGACLSRRERQAEWRDLVFLRSCHASF
jgi:hypothetical protein